MLNMKSMSNVQWTANEEIAAMESNESNENNKLTVESVDNHIYFYSYVDEDRCLALIKQILEIDKNLRVERESRRILSSDLTPIWLHINSKGGSVFDALAVSDQIQNVKTPIYSVAEGLCASAATLLSMSCKKRFILRNTFMLIHQFSGFVYGKHEEFVDRMKMNTMLLEKMIKFYVKNSNLEENTVREMLKRDSWFDADESLKNGFVDEIV